MGRSRLLEDVIDDAYKRADQEGATDRFPRADVVRYINQGRAALRDEIIKARGRSYFRKPGGDEFETTANTSVYDLPDDFYQLISVRVAEDGGDNLDPFSPLDEPSLRASGSLDWPSHYELQEATIELLPLHRAAQTIRLEYIPALEDVVDDSDPVEGYNGWEEFIVDFAALKMAEKDDEPRLKADLRQSLKDMKLRIAELAPKRDRFRAERTKDVRGSRMFGRR